MSGVDAISDPAHDAALAAIWSAANGGADKPSRLRVCDGDAPENEED